MGPNLSTFGRGNMSDMVLGGRFYLAVTGLASLLAHVLFLKLLLFELLLTMLIPFALTAYLGSLALR